MNYINILVKGISSVFILLIFTKLMGRKQVGELNIFDYIIGISIGSIAAEMTINNDIKLLEGILGISIYAIIAYIISILTMKSIILRRFIIGTPCIIIQNGKIIYDNLKKSKIDLNDMLEEARINGYFDLSEIEFAIMEANGNLSFLPKSKYKPLTPNDMKIKTDYKGITSNLIMDGNIMYKNLDGIKKTSKWLLTRLDKLGYKDINNILLLTCNSKENLTVYEKNTKENIKTLE